jgi:RNA polymerase sigma-70 factor (ECF subfamily)
MAFQEDSIDTDRLLALLRQNDRAGALELMMQRYGQAVHRLCCQMLNDTSLADDVCQQVFLEAYRDLQHFAGRSTVRTWLFAIARHRVLDAVKRRARRGVREIEVDELPEVSDPEPLAMESLDTRQLHCLLDELLDTLSEPARAAVLLRYEQEMSFDEIAASCGEDAAVLRMRVSRALRRLRIAIEARTSAVANRRRMRAAA